MKFYKFIKFLIFTIFNKKIISAKKIFFTQESFYKNNIQYTLYCDIISGNVKCFVIKGEAKSNDYSLKINSPYLDVDKFEVEYNLYRELILEGLENNFEFSKIKKFIEFPIEKIPVVEVHVTNELKKSLGL